MEPRHYYKELQYPEDLLWYIQEETSLLGIVNAYFTVHGKKHSKINQEAKQKIYPNNKFFYNICPSHQNSPNLYSFYVDEDKKLFYCLGCGTAGSVFEFIMNCYQIDINEATEVLGSILNLIEANLLPEKLKEISKELKQHYGKQDQWIEKSREKTQYLTTRVDTYLQKNHLENINIRKTANRLCCSDEFIEKRYHILLRQQHPKEKIKIESIPKFQ